jgi:AAA domain-containing protein/primase-like protein/DNA primase RepB-like protein
MPYTRPPGPRIPFDKAEAVKFLRLIDVKASEFCFQTFREKGDNNSEVFARVITSKSLAEVRKEHEIGAGIYVTINATDGGGRSVEHIVRIRAIWQEDDAGYDGAFPIAPSMIVESSPGHFHRYWLVAGEWPADEQGRADFAAVMERMVESYGSDKNAKDIARVLRVPGFLHRKGEPHMVRIVSEDGRRYTRAEILAAFPKVEREQKQTPHKEWKPQGDEEQRIREALYSIDADDRYTWLRCGMALKDEMGDSGRTLWDSWSRQSKKYNERDQEKTWKSFKRNGISIGTLFYEAQLAGWTESKTKSNHATESIQSGRGDNVTSIHATAAQASSERTAILVRADSLTPESISWAWQNRFAFGKMAMIAGDPGLGKSTILIEVAALHSREGEFPCGEGKAILCETVFLTAEDGLRDTLVPRLIAAEADMTKIHFLTGTKVEGASTDDMAMFDITKDVPVLRKVFTDNPAAKILIIDPLTAYLGAGAKAKENTDVRRVLTPLVKLIEEFGVLLLANNHLNKSGGKALYRILDSIAFVALGRTIHLVVEDADNRDNKKFICDKSNIGSKPLGLTYIIQKCWIDGEQGEQIETSRISWGTKHVDETADDALAADRDFDGRSSTDEAADFLATLLANGPVAVAEVEKQARAAGIFGGDSDIGHSKPFRSARRKLGVITRKAGMGDGWVWELPKGPPATEEDPAKVPSKSRAPFGEKGTFEEDPPLSKRTQNAEADPSFGRAPSGAPSLEEQGLLVQWREKYLKKTSSPSIKGKPSGPVHYVNGYNISRTPEDRQPPQPGELACYVKIREIRHPAISAGPDDGLDDFIP